MTTRRRLCEQPGPTTHFFCTKPVGHVEAGDPIHVATIGPFAPSAPVLEMWEAVSFPVNPK